jgi:hypothetical protein
MARPCVARGFVDLADVRPCINVSGLCLERVVLPTIMDISARAISLADSLKALDPERPIGEADFHNRHLVEQACFVLSMGTRAPQMG